jgi:energy-coupling factor transport system ATP-binding protein
MISIHKLHHIYRSPFFPEHRALSGVSFDIERGEMTALVGASGSGKTTLIQHFNGLLLPTSGRVRIMGRDLPESKPALSELRRKVGLVFQFPEFQLFEETVERDVAFGLKSYRLSGPSAARRVRRAMELVGLDWRTFRKRAPFHLSGGEKRRAALAGILVMEPEVLVLDEPTAGLDWEGTRHVEDILQAYHRSGRTVVFVSHDMDLVARLADRVIVLSGGKVAYDGGKKGLFSRAGLLKAAGLTLPHVVRFMRMLRRQGVPVRTDVFDVEEAKKEIRRVLGENPKYRRNYKL